MTNREDVQNRNNASRSIWYPRSAQSNMEYSASIGTILQGMRSERMNKIKAYNEALIGLIDMNPEIDACVADLLKQESQSFAKQVLARLKELDISSERFCKLSGLSPMVADALLEGKNLPNLAGLKAIANVLQCDLRIAAVSTTACTSSLCSVSPGTSLDDMNAALSRFIASFEMQLCGETWTAPVRYLASWDLDVVYLDIPKVVRIDADYVLSTTLLFRKAVARLCTIQLELCPTPESAQWNAVVV